MVQKKNNIDFQPKAYKIALLGLSVLSVGVIFYHKVEDMSWVNAIYFSVITLTTIGYGDIVPKTDLGKIFTVFYVLIGIGIFAAVINYLVKRAAIQRMNKLSEKSENKDK